MREQPSKKSPLHNYDRYIQQAVPFADQMLLHRKRKFYEYLVEYSKYLTIEGKQISVFISYAWGEQARCINDAHYPFHEKWTTKFCQVLAADLEVAGCRVLIDREKSRWDKNPVEYMKEGVNTSDFVLLFLTKTLKQKAESTKIKHNIQTEVEIILKRMNSCKPSGVIQVLLAGSIDVSMPDRLMQDDPLSDARRPIHNVDETLVENQSYVIFLEGLLRELIKRTHANHLVEVPNYQEWGGLIHNPVLLRNIATKLLNQQYSDIISDLTQNLLPPNQDAIDRPQYKSELFKRFASQPGFYQVVTGPPGIGKTQIALCYAQSYLADETRHNKVVRYFNAEELDILHQQVIQFGFDIGIDYNPLTTKVSELLRQILDALDRWDIHCLLLFDNAQVNLKPYIAHCRHATAQVLVLSRSNDWQNILNVEPFTIDECREYICRNGINHVIDKDDLEQLTRALRWYPLFFIQVIAYLKKTRFPISEYIEILSANPSSSLVMTQDGMPNHYPVNCFKAYDGVSAKILSESRDAYELLVFISYMASDNIPLSIFEEAIFFGAKTRVYNALARLNEYRLVNTSRDGKTTNIHRIVQGCIRSQFVDYPEEHSSCIKRLLRFFKIFIKDPINKPDRWKLTSTMLPHARRLAENVMTIGVTDDTAAMLKESIHILYSTAEYYFAAFCDYTTYIGIVDRVSSFLINYPKIGGVAGVEPILFLRSAATSFIVRARFDDAIDAIDRAINMTLSLKLYNDVTKNFLLFWMTHYKMIVYLNSGDYETGILVGREVEKLLLSLLEPGESLDAFVLRRESMGQAIEIPNTTIYSIKDQCLFFETTYGVILSFHGNTKEGVQRCMHGSALYGKSLPNGLARYAESLYCTAVAQIDSDESSAEDNLIKSLRLLESLSKSIDVADSLFILGWLKYKQDNFEMSLFYASKGAKLYKQHEFYKFLSCQVICSFACDALEDYKSAREHMQAAIDYHDIHFVDRHIPATKLNRIPTDKLKSTDNATISSAKGDMRSYWQFMCDCIRKIYGIEVLEKIVNTKCLDVPCGIFSKKDASSAYSGDEKSTYRFAAKL